jgi:hypothetical protein
MCISPSSILLLFSHLRLRLLNSPFPSDFPSKILYEFLPIRSLWSANLTLLDLIILFGEDIWLISMLVTKGHSVKTDLRITDYYEIFHAHSCNKFPSSIKEPELWEEPITHGPQRNRKN